MIGGCHAEQIADCFTQWTHKKAKLRCPVDIYYWQLGDADADRSRGRLGAFSTGTQSSYTQEQRHG